ncbi:MAG: DNA primase [Methylococcales bacterium]|nr:DNA primase [Methylococcales bacterium]
MSGFIPKDFIDDLLNRVDLVDLVRRFVPLKKQGASFVARCPFHDEKTPSFNVNPSKQLYYCFGCGASGNAISFLIHYQHLDFVEAVEDLAGSIGLVVPKEAGGKAAQSDQLTPLYALMAEVAAFYRQCLTRPEGAGARAYLERRGLGAEVAAEFELGYAPEAWQTLLERFDRALLAKAGLIVERDDHKAYDRFRNRLIFPIRDKRGRVIALGGRVLDDALPKYLNSPETPIFSKSREVYGLFEALKRVSRPEQLLVVEGYVDVIALAGAGVNCVVATLGTAITPQHIQHLFRQCHGLVFCFDGDAAGQKAAVRAMTTSMPLLQAGREVKFLTLPEGQDPDDYVRSDGVEAFQARLAAALPLSDFFFQTLTDGAEPGSVSVEQRARWSADGGKLLGQLPVSAFRALMFQRLTALCGVSDAARHISSQASGRARQAEAQGGKRSAARLVIALLLRDPALAEQIRAHTDWQQWHFPGAALLQQVMAEITTYRISSAAQLLEHFRDSEHWPTIQKLMAIPLTIPEEGMAAEFSDALSRLSESSRKQAVELLLEQARQRSLTESERLRLKELLASSRQ